MQNSTSEAGSEGSDTKGAESAGKPGRYDDAVAARENGRLRRSQFSRSVFDADGETWVVIIHRPGPMWSDPTLGFLDQQGIQAHIQHYRQLLAHGQLFMGGPFLNDGGGLMILSADATIEQVEQFALADPAVRSGLLHAEVHPWLAFMGRQESGRGDANTGKP